jgi:transglutaminase-like putative cysteine protease
MTSSTFFKPSPRASLWLSLSVLASFVALWVSTFSPLVTLLFGGYIAAMILPSRMARDSANVWGLRLLVYAGGAILGRMMTQGQMTFYDARAFITPGIILGGEIILQSFRMPPRGLRYDPVIILLTGLIFLIACNTYRPYLFILAPIYVFCTLVALREAREDVPTPPLSVTVRRLAFLGLACALGAVLHLQLWVYRSNIMALGARLLSSAQTTAQGDNVGENPQLGTNFNPNASTARLIRITGKLTSGHLRTAAFDIYRSGTWGPGLSSRTAQIKATLPEETREDDPKDPTKLRTDTDASLTVLRETNGVVFLPLNIYALVPRDGGSFDWKRYDGPVRTDDAPPITYSIINSRQQVGGFQTTQGPLTLAPDTKTGDNPSPDGRERRQLLEVPDEIDPRVRQLALEITRGAPTQLVKVSKIVAYLFANHKYSYEFIRTSQDPVSDFLLNKKAGHCQYFASAATILMRCAGVPARYASGYYAHEIASDGSTIVRGRDGHAWTEAYIKNVGWIAVDATVPDGRADPNVSPLPFYQAFTEWVQDSFTRVRDWFGRLTPLQIAQIMAVVLLIWGLERWRQTRKKARQQPQGLPLPADLAPLIQRFERVLARRGITLVPERPWSESLPTGFEAETRWVELYNRIRFSQDGAARLDELQNALETLEKTKVTAGPGPTESAGESNTPPGPNVSPN